MLRENRPFIFLDFRQKILVILVVFSFLIQNKYIYYQKNFGHF